MRYRLGIVGHLLRGAIALLLLVLCVHDWPAARAHWSLPQLPPLDYVTEARHLHAAGQEQAALLVIEEGLRQHAAADAERARLLALRAAFHQQAREAWYAPLRSAAMGALTGRADDAPGLVAAIASDLFVFGDVRDLAIQSGRGLRGEAVDPFIVGLSMAGLALTALPAADGGTAVLKAARRNHALSPALSTHVVRQAKQAVRTGDSRALRRLMNDASTLSDAMGVAPSQRVLRHVVHPKQLHHAAQFARQPGGAYALHAGGAPLLRWLPTADGAARAAALRAARMGSAGLDHFLRHARVLSRAHPALGFTKGLYKGHVAALLQQFLRQYAAFFVALAAAWLLLELAGLGLRLRARHAG
ncbi:hypothetical protein [Algiphilus sp.]|uniref:hypothetical protein n=1 Tax=Algiphilus sp. TaxID=1872431 RepID=UPI003B5194B2